MGRGALDGGVIIGTAGHIDHGKTALVKALTGVDTDRLPEEKRRGITVELGFAPIELGNGIAASVIDVPGHEAFVKTMVAGATGIDVALLVIAADEGMMPQTREHLAILELLEIPSLVVALTKSDLVDSDWLALVREEVASQLSESRWISPPIVPCSAATGAGLHELRAALSAAAPASERGSTADLFRLPVDRCFTMKGTGTVITGTVWSGELARDASVRILPSGLSARVRQLQRHGKEVHRIGPGERAAVALSGVEVADVPRGSSLVTDENWQAVSSLDVWARLLDDEGDHPDSRNELRFHLAGADVGAAIIFPAAALASNEGRFARLKLDAPVAARGGDRFILRLPAPVGTVGGGVILDTDPGRRAVSASAKIFNADSARDPQRRFESLIESASVGGIPVASLGVRIGLSPARMNALVSELGCVVAGGRCFAASSLDEPRRRIIAALEKSETTFPLETGVQFESAIASAGCDGDLARLAIAGLEAAGTVAVNGSIVRRAGWKPKLGASHEKTADSLVHAICSRGSEPPSAEELAKEYGGDVPVLLRYLEREGRVVQVAADRFYGREAVNALIEKLRTKLAPGEEYGPSQLRETLGFSRKYLIPFLEYCDRSGVMERKGDKRTLKSVDESLTQM
jgi:selenocysteine-specific elongation factor